MDIPEAELQHLTAVVRRFARWIEERRQDKLRRGGSGAYTLGITGGQGTGKTTMRRLLERELDRLGLRMAGFSLDDIYKTYAERVALREECPYFRFRGVFGTHDVELGMRILQGLNHEGGGTVRIPVFDKSLHRGAGDRLPRSQWRKFSGVADVVILEGWCVGARPQDEAQLAETVCDIERDPGYDNASGSFRRRINAELRDYQQLFGELDDLAVLQIPDVECIYRWREQQERELKSASGGAGMDPEMVRSFVDYFIPTTIRYVLPLGEDPGLGADIVFLLDRDHRITGVREFGMEPPREKPVADWLG